MKNILPFSRFLLILLYFFSLTSYCQTNNITDAVLVPRVQINLKDGTVIKGRIIKSTALTHTVDSDDFGTLDVPIDNIILISPIDDENLEKDKFNNFSIIPTSYLISPNAYNLKSGETRYANSMIFVNDFSIGLSNKFSVSIIPIIVPIPFFGVHFLCFFNGKFTQPISEKLNIGASIYVGASAGSNKAPKIGSVFATYGNPNSNLTVGFHTGVQDNGEWINLIQFSGTHRVTKRVALTGESIIFSNQENTYYSSPNSYYSTTKKSVSVGIILGAKIFYTRSILDIGLANGSNFNSNESSAPTPFIKFTTLLGANGKK